MPELGMIKQAREVGLSPSHRKVVWASCVDCGKERWVWLRSGKPQSERCFTCGRIKGGIVYSSLYRGEKTSRWKNGRTITREGYVVVTLSLDDPMAVMAPKGRNLRVREHRLIMARHLGRPLKPSEVVHHKNRNKMDNRIENLELFDYVDHALEHHNMNSLLIENESLKREIERLKRLLDAKTTSL